ncbi:hypothetical protein PAPH110629_03200 [Paenibacillus phoenicis]
MVITTGEIKPLVVHLCSDPKGLNEGRSLSVYAGMRPFFILPEMVSALAD